MLYRLLSRVSTLWVVGGVAVTLLSVALVTLLVGVLVKLQVLAPLVMPTARALLVMPWWLVVL